MLFKQIYISEAMKFNRYEKYVSQVLKALRESLLETMPYLEDFKTVTNMEEIKKLHFKLRLDFQKFKKAHNSITDSSDFEKYGHRFITIQVPNYLTAEDIDITFYFCLDDNAGYGGLTSSKKPEIMIVFDVYSLIGFVRNNKAVVETKEDAIVHELTHIIDPSIKKTKKMVQKTIKANIKADNDDVDEYYNLPWEKTAFHTQYVRRVIHNIVKEKEFHDIANERNVTKVTSYLMNKIKNLKEYLDRREEIKDRNKIYKELYKEVSDIVSLYKKSIEEK